VCWRSSISPRSLSGLVPTRTSSSMTSTSAPTGPSLNPSTSTYTPTPKTQNWCDRMVASRAAGVASSGRREWPNIRGGRWAGARRRLRHLDRQGRPRSAPELWEDRSDLDVGPRLLWWAREE
jgi:hypothetical protein